MASTLASDPRHSLLSQPQPQPCRLTPAVTGSENFNVSPREANARLRELDKCFLSCSWRLTISYKLGEAGLRQSRVLHNSQLVNIHARRTHRGIPANIAPWRPRAADQQIKNDFTVHREGRGSRNRSTAVTHQQVSQSGGQCESRVPAQAGMEDKSREEFKTKKEDGDRMETCGLGAANVPLAR